MIQKVNRPSYLSLVSSAKSADHDPGASSGSGLSYDGPPQDASQPQKNDSSEPKPEGDKSTPVLSVVVNEKMGMTEVVKDFYTQKKNEEAAPANPGLAIRYSNDSAPAKGLLLNRKAE